MDENVTISKEQKWTSLFLSSAASALMLTNASFVFTRQDKFSGFMPISIVLCAVSVVLTVIVLFSVILNYKKLSEKKRSVISLMLILLLCGIEISLCVSAVIDLNAKRNAKNSAVLFIKDKYGIDAEAVGYSGYTSSYSGVREETVKMTADGKEFTVMFISRDENEKHTADDLQADEIKQAIIDEVSRVYPNGLLRDVGIYNYDFISSRTVFEKYFNGTNLDEVIVNCRGDIEVDYADTEFDLEDPLFEKLNKWHIAPYFTSFDTAAHLEEFVWENEPKTGFIRNEQYAKYAPYINDCVEYNYNKENNKREIIRKSYNIKSCGEFDYLFRDIAENEKGAEKIEQRFAKYADTALGKPVTKVYKREYSGSSSFFIYYSLEKLNGTTVENIEAAWISDSAGSNNAFGTQKAEVIGNYAVFVLPYYVEEFIIVGTSGYNEDNQR
ncbi:MAG: hypothetical protein K2N38_04505 [Oscillospiraceae bacterium]|nr:hypothetical protein [Oscillospiraceae bacterium]